MVTEEAKKAITQLEHVKVLDFELIAVHSVVAVMQWDIPKAFDIIRLLSYANSML